MLEGGVQNKVSTVYQTMLSCPIFYGFYNDLINRNSTSLSHENVLHSYNFYAIFTHFALPSRCASTVFIGYMLEADVQPTSLLSNLIEINLSYRKLV